MRTFQQIIILFIVVACSHAPHQNINYESSNSILKDEALIVGSSSSSDFYLQSCYQNDMPEFYSKAQDHFEKNPKDWRYWSIMGNCLLWKNQIKEALFYLKSSFMLAPGEKEKAVVLVNMGIANLRMNRPNKGSSMLLEAYKSLPNSSVLNFNLAQFYLSYSDTKNAEKYLSKLSKTSKIEAEILHLLGIFHSLNKDLVKTSAYLSQLPASYETREDVSLTLAQWKLDQGNWEEASKLLSNRKSSSLDVLELRAKNLKEAVNKLKVESEKIKNEQN
jgi:predicted Zn-dependent protease